MLKKGKINAYCGEHKEEINDQTMDEVKSNCENYKKNISPKCHEQKD